MPMFNKEIMSSTMSLSNDDIQQHANSSVMLSLQSSSNANGPATVVPSSSYSLSSIMNQSKSLHSSMNSDSEENEKEIKSSSLLPSTSLNKQNPNQSNDSEPRTEMNDLSKRNEKIPTSTASVQLSNINMGIIQCVSTDQQRILR